MDLYRADKRTLKKMQDDFPRGFEAWVPLTAAQARKFVSLCLGSSDTDGLPLNLVSQYKDKNNFRQLGDFSTFIKYNKDQSTVWISTAINTECGGQSGGATRYKFTFALNEFSVVNKKLVPLVGGRKSALKPTLLLDGAGIADSNFIAINHGPLDDAEVSFLTTIPLDKITGTL